MTKPSPPETQLLTKKNLKNVPPAPSNLQTYLRREQKFEKVALGLSSNREDGESMTRDWERTWKAAGEKRNKGSRPSASFSEGWRMMDMYYTGTVI
jgi:hypothetical protein